MSHGAWDVFSGRTGIETKVRMTTGPMRMSFLTGAITDWNAIIPENAHCGVIVA